MNDCICRWRMKEQLAISLYNARFQTQAQLSQEGQTDVATELARRHCVLIGQG